MPRPIPTSRIIAAPGSVEHLAGYTGILNIETIGGRMIEVHLRMSDQWPDLYGAGWVDAVVRLYHQRRWDFADDDRRDGVQRRAVRAARAALSPSAAGAGRTGAAHARRLERADHLPRGQGARASTPCRPAASGSPWSTPGTCAPAAPGARCCGRIFSPALPEHPPVMAGLVESATKTGDRHNAAAALDLIACASVARVVCSVRRATSGWARPPTPCPSRVTLCAFAHATACC